MAVIQCVTSCTRSTSPSCPSASSTAHPHTLSRSHLAARGAMAVPEARIALSLSFSLSLTHTHTLSLSLTHTHSLSLSVALSCTSGGWYLDPACEEEARADGRDPVPRSQETAPPLGPP